MAVDTLGGDDMLDFIDRGGVALGGNPRAFGAMQLFEFNKTVIQGAGQVRGASGFAASDVAAVQHDHLRALARQQISRGQLGNTRSDDDTCAVVSALNGGKESCGLVTVHSEVVFWPSVHAALAAIGLP